MQSKSPLAYTPWVATCLVAACGGGGGGGDAQPQPAALATRNTAEGIWFGRTTSGFRADVVVLEDGRTWGIFSDVPALYGAIQGTASGAGGTFSGTFTEYSFLDNSQAEVTYGGTVADKTSIDATGSTGTRLLLAYSARYEQPASPATLAGSYALSGTNVVTIDTAGAFRWVASATCTLAGEARPHASGKNVFDLSLTYAGAGCMHGNGTRLSGVAYVDAASAPNRLIALALRADRAIGFIAVGEKMAAGTAAPSAAPAPSAGQPIEQGPTPAPTPPPTAAPTPAPTAAPTPAPTAAPTPAPTPPPTAAPTPAPTAAPTPAPTPAPTAAPTPAPTAAPTPAPTAAPTPAPTAAPTPAPTAAPTPAPTAAPTPAPAPAAGG